MNTAFTPSDVISAIQGYTVQILTSSNAVGPGQLKLENEQTRHIVLTAETHNFPTGLNFRLHTIVLSLFISISLHIESVVYVFLLSTQPSEINC